MRTIAEIVNTTTVKMIEDGTIEKVIEKGVENMIIDVINDQFKPYGSLAKATEKAIEEGLQIDTKQITFDIYNQQMLALINARLGDMFQGQAAERFKAQINKTLSPAPKEMNIHDFVNTITEMWHTDEPWDANDLDEYATVEFEKCNIASGWTLKMWKQKANYRGLPSSRKEDVHLYISKKGEISISHNFKYNPTCLYAEDGFIIKLYAAGTILTGLEDYNPDDYDYELKELAY